MELHLPTFALIFAACAVVAALTIRLRQSVIVGYLLAGALIGPYGLGWVSGKVKVEEVGNIGVIFLLFLLGTELSLERIKPLARPALIGGTLQILFTIAATLVFTSLSGWIWYRGALLGCFLSLSSTAIVVKLLDASDELRAPHGKFSLGVLLFQDMAVVPMMVLLPILAPVALTAEEDPVSKILIACAKAAAFLLLSFAAGRYIIPPVLRIVARTRSQELFTLTVLALALGMAVASDLFGLSLAMGAFIAGLALGQSPFSQKILADVLPFRDAFLSIFFVAIGMLLDWRAAGTNALAISIVVAFIIGMKTLVVSGVGRLLGLPLGMAIQAGLALSQVGEFSFLLAMMARQRQHVEEDLYQIFISSSVVTMALTPWLMKAGSWISRLGPRLPALGGAFREPRPPEGHAEGFKDHIVICGFGPVGRLAAAALRQVGAPFVVLELNPDTVARVRKEGIPIIYGDARSEVILEMAGLERAKGLVVAIPAVEIAEAIVRNARLRVPKLPIYARAVFVPHVRRLEDAGATVTVHDEREAGRAIVRALLEGSKESPEAVEALLDRLGREGREKGGDPGAADPGSTSGPAGGGS